MREVSLSALLLVLCTAGCDDDLAANDLAIGEDAAAADLAAPADLSMPADLAVEMPAVSATGRANPDVVVSGFVDVVASHAATVVVDYGATTSYGLRSRVVPVPAGGTVTLPVLGLAPAATNHLRVTATSAGGFTADSGDFTITTGALPAELPNFSVTVPNPAANGYLLVSFWGTGAWNTLIDRAGRVMWYRRSTPSSHGVFFDRQNGNFSVFQYATGEFEEVNESNVVVHRWTNPGAPFGADGHEQLYLPNGNVLLFGWDAHTVDVGAYADGGLPNATVFDNTIDEVDRDGGVQFHWATWPQVTLAETTRDIPLAGANLIDSTHPNALEIAPDGNILASFRHLDSILKINRSSGAIVWRLGGKKSDFTFLNDPLGGFSHQHDVRFVKPNEILLMDNGNLHAPPVSRAVQYRLDESAKTATLVWEHRHDPDRFSGAAGSVRRLPNGNTVIAWALDGYALDGIIEEVDPFGGLVWELRTTGLAIYRAVPTDTLYP